MNKNILIVDDDKRLRELLKDYLTEKNLQVYQSEDYNEAKEILSLVLFDLIILDRMMPSGDGIELIEHIKQFSNTPIIMLTAMGEDKDKIDGLKIGADDYLSKPFEPRELILRIKKLIKREKNIKLNQIIFGEFSFDLDTLILKEGNKRIYLTSAEQELFLCFANKPNKIIPRMMIENTLEGRMVGRSIDVAISRLRIKIEQNPRNPVFLQNIRGHGWILKID